MVSESAPAEDAFGVARAAPVRTAAAIPSIEDIKARLKALPLDEVLRFNNELTYAFRQLRNDSGEARSSAPSQTEFDIDKGFRIADEGRAHADAARALWDSPLYQAMTAEMGSRGATKPTSYGQFQFRHDGRWVSEEVEQLCQDIARRHYPVSGVWQDGLSIPQAVERLQALGIRGVFVDGARRPISQEEMQRVFASEFGA